MVLRGGWKEDPGSEDSNNSRVRMQQEPGRGRTKVVNQRRSLRMPANANKVPQREMRVGECLGMGGYCLQRPGSLFSLGDDGTNSCRCSGLEW